MPSDRADESSDPIRPSRRDILLGGALAGTLGLAGCGFVSNSNPSGESQTTLTAEWIRTTDYPTISVDAFGATGDGNTDDAEAIQEAVDSASESSPGILSFSPGKTYRIGSPVQIDAGTVRGIEGNNALIAVDGSFPAITYAGRFDNSSGPSSGDNQELITREFVSYLNNIHLSSTGDSYRGVGLLLDGTLGTVISGCHCFQLHTGLQVMGRQRNLVFVGNHLFDNRVAGLAFRGTNLHQVNVVGNHVMWSEAPIEASNSKLFNVQLVGNDVEVGNGADTPLEVRSGRFTEVQITGNTIQGHGCERILDVEPDTLEHVVIADNHLSNCEKDAIRLSGPIQGLKGVAVSDNTFKNVDGHAIAIAGNEITGVSVTGNSVQGGNCALVTSPGPVRDVQIANNVAVPIEAAGNVIGVVSAADISSTVLSGNIVRSNEAFPDDFVHLCRVEADGRLRFTTVTDNQLRSGGANEFDGLRVAGESVAGVVVKNNVVGEIAQEATALELPTETESSVITSPNIAVPEAPD